MKRILPAIGMLCIVILAAPCGLGTHDREASSPPANGETGPALPAEAQPEEKAVTERLNVSIEVNIPATEMTLFENGVPLFRRRVAIGQGVYPTPVQESSIKKIEWNPWWYPPPADWAKNEKPTPPGPGNPLGLVKMALSDAILFHGTNKEWTVGLPASHGCMRMANRDVTALAWYLQQRFSDKADPALREQYRKNRGTTYPVALDPPVPVELVYRPVVVRNGGMSFYPDHYGRMWGRREAAILGALLRSGIDIAIFDDAKVEELSEHWPPRGTEVPLEALMRTSPPSPPSGPECS